MKIKVQHEEVCYMIHLIHGKIKDTEIKGEYIDGDNPDIFTKVVNRNGKSYWRDIL